MRSLPTTIEWIGSPAAGYLRLLDQTRLPGEVRFRDCRSAAEVWDAIRQLQVRGAPAIGVAAAYGVVIGTGELAYRQADVARTVEAVARFLATSRPTAVNLFHALERMCQLAREMPADTDVEKGQELLFHAARQWHQEDIDLCAAIARHGAPLVPEGGGVLTHCNTGALATAGIGTALGCLLQAAAEGRRFTVFVDETRPLLQGARLTAWELQQAGLNPILVCDNMAGHLMRLGRVQMVIVGADRIAANGDTANKIGTYGLAVLARHHGIPFYVAAPCTTFDPNLPDGHAIQIEERPADEITLWGGQRIAPPDVQVFNPAFDVTPGTMITGIITEAGLIKPGNMAAQSAS